MGNRRALSDRPPSPRVCHTAGCDPLCAFPCHLRGDTHVTARPRLGAPRTGVGSRGARRDAYWLVTVWRSVSVCPPPPLAPRKRSGGLHPLGTGAPRCDQPNPSSGLLALPNGRRGRRGDLSPFWSRSP